MSGSATSRILERVTRMVGTYDDGPVIVEIRGRSSEVVVVAEEVARTLGRPLYRLRHQDLAAPPLERVAALGRLLDAAQVSGAAVLVDGADGFAGDDEWLAQRMRTRMDEAVGLLVVCEADGREYKPSIVNRRHVVAEAGEFD